MEQARQASDPHQLIKKFSTRLILLPKETEVALQMESSYILTRSCQISKALDTNKEVEATDMIRPLMQSALTTMYFPRKICIQWESRPSLYRPSSQAPLATMWVKDNPLLEQVTPKTHNSLITWWSQAHSRDLSHLSNRQWCILSHTREPLQEQKTSHSSPLSPWNSKQRCCFISNKTIRSSTSWAILIHILRLRLHKASLTRVTPSCTMVNRGLQNNKTRSWTVRTRTCPTIGPRLAWMLGIS